MEESAIISSNRLLALLSAADYQRLEKDLKLILLTKGQIIYQPDELIESVYFPIDAVISLGTIPSKRSRIEASLVGREGMLGLTAILGGRQSLAGATVVQLSGQATQLSATVLQSEFQRGLALQKLMLRYVEVRLMQVSQLSACQSWHSLKPRLIRWLLILQDCVQKDQLPLTQQFIAEMLGVRRAGVNEVANALQAENLIRCQRGQITILNRAGLEESACECYQFMNLELNRILA